MITVDRRQFSRAIKLASQVVEKRHTIPVLTAVKMTANGKLSIEGTDLDTFARAEIEYDGDEGEIMLSDPRSVISAINVAGGETVEFGRNEKRVTVKAGKLDASLISQHPDDYPGNERIAEQTFGCTIGASEMAQIRRVMAAISTEETRYYLNGVNVKKLADWTYRFAATDGHRLMVVDIPLPDAAGDLPEQFIIPRRFLNAALNSFAKPKDGIAFRVGLTANSNQRDKTLAIETSKFPRICFSGEVAGTQFEIVGKLIDGTYPDYTRVIPSETTYLARCKRADLIKAINTLTPLSTSKTRAVKLTFADGSVRLELNSPDVGDSSFVLPAEHNLPKDFMVGFNGQYLLDNLAALEGEEVDLGLTDPAAPATVTDPADTAFKSVLMPMRG